MAAGCTHPSAANYNAGNAPENNTCIFLVKLGGICYAFQEVAPGADDDQSFTLSWALKSNNWVYFHGYIPDFYFSSWMRVR